MFVNNGRMQGNDLTDDDGTLGGAVLGVDDLDDGFSIVTVRLW